MPASSYVPTLTHGPDLDVWKVLKEEDCDPIKILARHALGDDPTLSFAAARELAQYIHPKKRALDLRAHVKTQVSYQIVSFASLEPDQAKELAAASSEMMKTRMPKTRDAVRLAEAAAPRISPQIIEAMRDNMEAEAEEDEAAFEGETFEGLATLKSPNN